MVVVRGEEEEGREGKRGRGEGRREKKRRVWSERLKAKSGRNGLAGELNWVAEQRE